MQRNYESYSRQSLLNIMDNAKDVSVSYESKYPDGNKLRNGFEIGDFNNLNSWGRRKREAERCLKIKNNQ